MGVAALFRWLSQSYPKIISPALEEQPRNVGGHEIPVDATRPNTNGEEFDNLYLDFNGIVHNAVHPEGKPIPANEAEMMMNIFAYTDRIVKIVRPRKVLMIAVDGVAPRAKMNQQRSRRFRAAQEAEQKDKDKLELLKLLTIQSGGAVDEAALLKKTWDTNSITPGTPFMNTLAQSLRYWVAYKLNTDPSWLNLKVIISDASVVGEGEHKIMNFVRSQRRDPQYNPNTRHVVYGLDADLIMLGLGAHEPYFRILREDVFYDEAKQRKCHLCGQPGHFADQCNATSSKSGVEVEKKEDRPKPFIWLHIPVLREYLEVELQVPNLPFKDDFERAIDDWVFICFFIGNDFLPHLPALDIRDGAINTLVTLWKKSLPLMGGYLTKDGEVDLARAQYILTGLAKQEDELFRRKKEGEDRREAGAKRRKLEQDQREASKLTGLPSRPTAQHYNSAIQSIPGQADTQKDVGMTNDLSLNSPSGLISQENVPNRTKKSSAPSPLLPSTIPSKRKPSESPTPRLAPPEPPRDNVRLWEEGYADRYYQSKFHVSPQDISFRREVAKDYAIGLCWVMRYYYQDCASWQWFYPHHYAPFAADFTNLVEISTNFIKGSPSKPYEQLMSVMPSASKHTLPSIFHSLMSSVSEIADFYPSDFEIDLNGKKFAHQGVVLLPFIDENRLLSAMKTKYSLLSEEEHLRNERGDHALLFSLQHPLYSEVVSHLYSKHSQDFAQAKLRLRPEISQGLAGIVARNHEYIPGLALRCPLATGENSTALMPDLDEDRSMSVTYDVQKFETTHRAVILPGVKFPLRTLTTGDKDDVRTGRNAFRGGRGRGNRGYFQGGPSRGYQGQNGGFAMSTTGNGWNSGSQRHPRQHAPEH